MRELLYNQKIMQRDRLGSIVHSRQRAGEHGVFTNGCFDLLHLGHVRYLQEARNLGDFLILGLNSDESTRMLKGPGRPLVPEKERAEILAALTCIDYAGAQGDAPDTSRLPEAKVVQAYGGIVRLISYLPYHSTTELITKIKQLPTGPLGTSISVMGTDLEKY